MPRTRTPLMTLVPRALATLLVLGSSIVVLVPATSATEYSLGAQLGYLGGAGAELQGEVAHFAADFPLSLRVGASLATREPGVAADARRIFINDATNGTPVESGRLLAFRLDLAYPLTRSERSGIYLFAGPRYGAFTGSFQFIGGNEDFDITSDGWGAGLGAEGRFQMGTTTQFVIGGGGDYYPNARLSGHDTAYDPSGETINGRANYTYANADEAVNQPKWSWRLSMGVNYLFGR